MSYGTWCHRRHRTNISKTLKTKPGAVLAKPQGPIPDM